MQTTSKVKWCRPTCWKQNCYQIFQFLIITKFLIITNSVRPSYSTAPRTFLSLGYRRPAPTWNAMDNHIQDVDSNFLRHMPSIAPFKLDPKVYGFKQLVYPYCVVWQLAGAVAHQLSLKIMMRAALEKEHQVPFLENAKGSKGRSGVRMKRRTFPAPPTVIFRLWAIFIPRGIVHAAIITINDLSLCEACMLRHGKKSWYESDSLNFWYLKVLCRVTLQITPWLYFSTATLSKPLSSSLV